VGIDKALRGAGESESRTKVEAVVVSERPRLIFEVALPAQRTVLAHLTGMVKRNFVRLIPGDRVEVELSPHDPTRGRILRKL
jgi:translation initiation factor IF-1